MTFDTERFIIEMQNRPSLWDSFADVYSNRDLKKKCWEEVVDIFGGEAQTVGEKKELGLSLQKKWKGIRACFTRELKRQKASKSGSGAERKSEYIFFKHKLQFLQKGVAIRKTEDEGDDSVQQEGMEESADRSQKQKKRNANKENEDDPFVAAINKSIETRERREQDENDEDRMFLLSLVNTLKEIPKERKMATKIKLMSVLNDAVPKNYDDHFSYSHGSSFRPVNYDNNYHSGYSGFTTQRTHNQVNLQPQEISSPTATDVTNDSDSLMDLY